MNFALILFWGSHVCKSPKKTLRAIQAAVQAEVGSLLRVIVNARRKVGAFDLEALEQATRAALHRAGARLLEELLAETEDEGQPPLCTCGSPMRCLGRGPSSWSACSVW